ncbi:hypothetical protein [Nocardiopsis sp. NPDC057823]|uniref:hypothetical protein n=1 Tax=Nocardiopsis sp. NPDC057823 TaxID=3346256 RepID=UPI003670D38D
MNGELTDLQVRALAYIEEAGGGTVSGQTAAEALGVENDGAFKEAMEDLKHFERAILHVYPIEVDQLPDPGILSFGGLTEKGRALLEEHRS